MNVTHLVILVQLALLMEVRSWCAEPIIEPIQDPGKLMINMEYAWNPDTGYTILGRKFCAYAWSEKEAGMASIHGDSLGIWKSKIKADSKMDAHRKCAELIKDAWRSLPASDFRMDLRRIIPNDDWQKYSTTLSPLISRVSAFYVRNDGFEVSLEYRGARWELELETNGLPRRIVKDGIQFPVMATGTAMDDHWSLPYPKEIQTELGTTEVGLTIIEDRSDLVRGMEIGYCEKYDLLWVCPRYPADWGRLVVGGSRLYCVERGADSSTISVTRTGEKISMADLGRRVLEIKTSEKIRGEFLAATKTIDLSDKNTLGVEWSRGQLAKDILYIDLSWIEEKLRIVLKGARDGQYYPIATFEMDEDGTMWRATGATRVRVEYKLGLPTPNP